MIRKVLYPAFRGKATTPRPREPNAGEYGRLIILTLVVFGEALQLVREQLDQKNVYYINPALKLQR